MQATVGDWLFFQWRQVDVILWADDHAGPEVLPTVKGVGFAQTCARPCCPVMSF